MKILYFSKISFIGFILLMCLNQAQAQTSISGIVNTYYPVSAVSGTTVTVGTSTGATHTLAAGDWVMLIQMTGEPAIRAGSNMGKYEVAQVSSVAGSNVTLSAVTRTYTTTEKVQLVWIPYSATGFNVTGTVTPLPWNGTTGGIVALKGTTLTLTSNIDATASGFSNTNTPGGTVLGTAPLGAGSTSGRGYEGGTLVVITPYSLSTVGGSLGGGGVGGGGVGYPGYIGGNPGQGGRSQVGVTSPGVNGGEAYFETTYRGAGTGSGGGGGIFGGGGGGGGLGVGATYVSAGGGGVAGGGASKIDAGGAPRWFSSGGGSGGVGNGGDGVGGGPNASGPSTGTEGSAGGGGGSYGGGGGGPNNYCGGHHGAGGGGGGSYTGGGAGGLGGTNEFIFLRYPDGGAGNDAVSLIPDAAHYLKSSDSRLMMGGAGGRGSGFGGYPTYVAGGNGGGIVFLEFASMAGPGDIISNGGTGTNGTANWARSGGGGGGGGQMALKVGTFTSVVDISAAGGVGGTPSADSYHAGISGAGGGAGGIWIQTQDAASRTVGATEDLANVTVNLSGGNAGAQIADPVLGLLTVTGGAGGVGLIVVDPIPCTVPTFTLTQTAPTCASGAAQNNGKITLTVATNATKYGVSTGATYTGAAYSSAIAIGTLPIDIQTAIPNTGGTYTIRIFNGTDNCYKDSVVTVANVICCPVTNYAICSGETYTLTAQSGMTGIQWQVDNGTGYSNISGANGTTYIVSTTGTYRYTATDGNACSAIVCCLATFTLDPSPSITNPSAPQTLCAAATGNNLTVNTTTNTANAIRFVRFTSDQSATNGSETSTELNNIYAGTAIATVTPTGASSPYTATYTWNSGDFPNATALPITYYVYAILDPSLGAGCKPVQEIQITVNPLPSPPSVTTPVMNPCPATTVNLNNISAALTPSVSSGIFEWHVSNSSGSVLVSNPMAVSAGVYYLFEKSPANCYSAGTSLQVQIQTCCPVSLCIPVTITRVH